MFLVCHKCFSLNRLSYICTLKSGKMNKMQSWRKHIKQNKMWILKDAMHLKIGASGLVK